MIQAVLGRSRITVSSLWIACLVFFSATPAIIAGATTSQPSKPCVAVLVAEVVGKMSPEERKALAGQLDTLLTESLAKQKGFVTVDRQALEKVIAERTAKAGGLTKIDPKDVATSLRPFFASGILICPTIHKGKQGKMIVSVEAVLAQTGQLLAELHGQGDWKNGRWAKPPKVSKNLGRFWADIQRNLKRNFNRPVVEVAAGRLTSKLTRLQWMVDELTDALRAGVGAEHGVVLLTPRYPLSTKEERLLRVMGLSVAKRGDKAAGLAPTPDMRLTTELIETISNKVGFQKTPITVKLTLRAGGKAVASKSFSGMVRTFEKIQVQAGKWFVEQLGKSAKTSIPVDAEELARKIAKEELAAAKRLASLGYYGASPPEKRRHVRLVRHALRAAHLDPTCEESVYLAARNIASLYSARNAGNTLACKDRIISEGLKYLDRFAGKVPSHHREILREISQAGYSASWKVRSGSSSFTSILNKPNVRLYFYARANVRAIAEIGYLAETDKRYSGTNAFRVMGHRLRRDLIPTIPDEYLDEEYKYWRGFWEIKVAKVPGDKADPWDLIEAAFQARRRDAKGLRATLQRLAEKYPKSETSIWRLGWEQIIPLYLRAAGDPKWKTWKPRFGAGAITLTYADIQAHNKRCYQHFPTVWDYPNLPVLKATKLVFPKRVMDMGFPGKGHAATYPRIEPLCRAGGDMWFITPSRWRRYVKASQSLHIIPAGKADAGSGKITVNPTLLPWPKHPTVDLNVKLSDGGSRISVWCRCVTTSDSGPTVWIGTHCLGIVRFDKKDGRWVGRWYTRRDGMPSDAIYSIFPYQDGGVTKLLVSGPSANRQNSARYVFWTIDPSDNSVKIVDKKVQRFIAPDKLQSHIVSTRGEKADSPNRLWSFTQNHPGENELWEIMPPKVQNRLVGRAPRHIWGFVPGQCPLQPVCPIDGFNKNRRNEPIATGYRRTLWIAIHGQQWLSSPRKPDGLLIYRPAAVKDAKRIGKDRWIGPFQMPGGKSITNLWNDGAGHIWVTTSDGIYRVDAEKFLASKLVAGQTRTTSQWRKQYQKRLDASNWRCRVLDKIAAGKWDEAIAILDTHRGKLGTVTAKSDKAARDDHVDLMTWRALVTANRPDGAKRAIELYERVVADPLADHVAKYRARKKILILFCKVEQYKEALRRSEEFYRLYPQGRKSSSEWKSLLELQLDKARNKVATPKPPSGGCRDNR